MQLTSPMIVKEVVTDGHLEIAALMTKYLYFYYQNDTTELNALSKDPLFEIRAESKCWVYHWGTQFWGNRFYMVYGGNTFCVFVSVCLC